MAFLGLFKKKDPEDYEQVLSNLAVDIQKRQTHLADIRQRERRTTMLVTLYALAAWIAYVAAWYTGLLPRNIRDRLGSGKAASFIIWIPIVVGPILVQLTRRIVQTWYQRIGNREEKTLKDLLAQQRTKVEEIKKKTNYYTTKNLIDKYDTTPSSTPIRQRPAALKQQQQHGPPVTPPQRPMQANGQPIPQSSQQSPNISLMGLQGAATPMTPPRRQWYDKLADALLGDDELNMNNAATRYALICQKCFTHNGLVKEDTWEDAQFRCMRCNHFNPSKRSLKSPTSPSAPLPRSSGLRQSLSPTDISFESAVSSSPSSNAPQQNFPLDAARPRPSHAPKPPSPLSMSVDLPEDTDVHEDVQREHPQGMELAM